MKTYDYKTDAESGEVEADSLIEAVEKMRSEARLTPRAIADGGWGWVEDPDTGAREYIAEKNI